MAPPPSMDMASPPSTAMLPSATISPVVKIIIRAMTFLSILASVIIIATNSYTSIVTVGLSVIEVKVKFSAFYAYRYMLATGVVGMAYALLQTALTVSKVTTGNRFGGDGLALFDFYGDKVFSYMLATGAAAGFGLTVDLNRSNDSESDTFLSKANAAASLLFIGFIFSAISSVFSSFSLPKKVV